eukprot:s1874_g4.t1
MLLAVVNWKSAAFADQSKYFEPETSLFTSSPRGTTLSTAHSLICTAFTMSLKETVPFEKRAAEASRILSKYPDRVPVICEKAPRTNLPEIEKKKFLVPGSMLCGEFKYIVHKHIQQAANGTGLAADQVIYLFTTNGRSNTAVKTGALMSEIYDGYKSDDGFLYIAYSAENTLG